jgi:hypothetical protein
METGQVGDLYLYSVGGTGGTEVTTILWLCIAPAFPNPPTFTPATWAQVQLGNAIGG